MFVMRDTRRQRDTDGGFYAKKTVTQARGESKGIVACGWLQIKKGSSLRSCQYESERYQIAL